MVMRKKFGPLENINKTNLKKVPDNPGVYGIFTGGGNIQKVGRAKRYRPDDRIKESQKEIQDKGRQAKKFGFISTKSVEDAKKLETKLIRTRKPPFNIEKKGK